MRLLAPASSVAAVSAPTPHIMWLPLIVTGSGPLDARVEVAAPSMSASAATTMANGRMCCRTEVIDNPPIECAEVCPSPVFRYVMGGRTARPHFQYRRLEVAAVSGARPVRAAIRALSLV